MQRQNNPFAALLFSAIAVFASAAAHAQATIDQNKALAGNLTPGDAAGFPVTLSVPGSYKLTGNLVVPAGLSGIVVTASGVTLDLNGFNISGPILCTHNQSSFAVTCTPVTAQNWGVEMMSGGNTVRNGAVRGFFTGVRYLGADQIENMLIEHNAGYGVLSASSEGARTLIRGVRSQFNGVDGFGVSAALIQNSTSSANGRHGFRATRSVVFDSVAVNNFDAGFSGNNLVVGRTMSEANHGGDYVGTTSAGGNIAGTSSQPF